MSTKIINLPPIFVLMKKTKIIKSEIDSNVKFQFSLEFYTDKFRKIQFYKRLFNIGFLVLYFNTVSSQNYIDYYQAPSKNIYNSGTNGDAQDFIRVGMYREAYEQAVPSNYIPFITDLKTLKTAIAKNAILDSLKNYKVLLINEAHDDPKGRVFLYSLVNQLYKLGFKDYFLESASDLDSTINEDRQVKFKSGTYSRVPSMGNLYRKILSEKSDIHFYDGFDQDLYDTLTYNETHYIYQKTKPQDPSYRWFNDSFVVDKKIYELWNPEFPDMNRDILAALRIQKQTKDKDRKFVIFCGHFHGVYSNGFYSLGEFYRYLSKEKTFVVEQSIVTEKPSKIALDVYSQVSHLSESVVLLNPDSSAINTVVNAHTKEMKIGKIADVILAHPKASYINNRPTFRTFENEYRRTRFHPPKNLKRKAFLVLVYLENELKSLKDDALVMDVIYYEPQKAPYDLLLLPNRDYILKFVSSNKEIESHKLKLK
jgi:hypothetical protein